MNKPRVVDAASSERWTDGGDAARHSCCLLKSTDDSCQREQNLAGLLMQYHGEKQKEKKDRAAKRRHSMQAEKMQADLMALFAECKKEGCVVSPVSSPIGACHCRHSEPISSRPKTAAGDHFTTRDKLKPLAKYRYESGLIGRNDEMVTPRETSTDPIRPFDADSKRSTLARVRLARAARKVHEARAAAASKASQPEKSQTIVARTATSSVQSVFELPPGNLVKIFTNAPIKSRAN